MCSEDNFDHIPGHRAERGDSRGSDITKAVRSMEVRVRRSTGQFGQGMKTGEIKDDGGVKG